MYFGSLPPVSNRATWTQSFQLFDDETGEGIDLAGAAITLELRRQGCATAALSATTANGRIAIGGEGTFALTIEAAAMRGLGPVQHDCGITVTHNDETTQYFIGTLPVLDGIVS